MEQISEQLQPNSHTIQSKITLFQKEAISAIPQSLIAQSFIQSSKYMNKMHQKNNFQITEEVNQEVVYNTIAISRTKLKSTQPRVLCGTNQRFYTNLQDYNNKNSLLSEYQKSMFFDIKDCPKRNQTKKIIRLRGRLRTDNKENTNISSRGVSNPTDDQSHFIKKSKDNSKIILKTQPKFLNITLTQCKKPSLSHQKSEFHTPSKQKRFITDLSHSQRKGIKVFSQEKKQMSLIQSTKKKCNRLSEVYSTTLKQNTSYIMQKSFTTNIAEPKKKSVIRLYIGPKQQAISMTRIKVLKPTKNPSVSVATSRRIAQQQFFRRLSQIKPNKTNKKPTRYRMINSISSKINIFNNKA